MGSDHQGIEVVFDTAESGLVVESDLCRNSEMCAKDAAAFHTETSTSYSLVDEAAISISEEFGVYDDITMAYKAQDKVWASYPSISAIDFPFYAISQMEGEELSQIQGVLGLGRQSEYGNNELYLERVKSTGHVSKEQISFNFGRTDEDSYADWGAYTPSSIKDGSEDQIAWFDQREGDGFWEFTAVQGVQFGFNKYTSLGMTAGYQYGYELEMPAIVSTGSALIYAPIGLGHELQLRMSKFISHYYDPESGVMIVNCSDKTWFQDFSIWIDNMEFEILVDDYFLSMAEMLGDEATSEHDDVCFLAIIDDAEADYWTLGDAFLKGYYGIFDNDDHAAAKMGFAPHATSSKKFVEQTRLPVESLENILWELTWAAAVFGTTGPLSFISWMIGSFWVWFFGIYEMGEMNISVTVS